jgi:hypothetical protein
MVLCIIKYKDNYLFAFMVTLWTMKHQKVPTQQEHTKIEYSVSDLRTEPVMLTLIKVTTAYFLKIHGLPHICFETIPSVCYWQTFTL